MSAASRAEWPPRRIVGLVVAALLVAACSLGGVGANALAANVGIKAGSDQFSVAAWELRHFTGKWFYAFDQLFHDQPSVDQQNALLNRFYSLTSQIDALEQSQSDAAARGQTLDPTQTQALDFAREERAGIQREAESILQGRLTAVIRSEGITRDLGLVTMVWPPVNFEFTDPPRMLATSPRDHIELQSQTPLRDGLNLTQIEKIEEAREKSGKDAALAFPLGGLGAYPTLVDYDDDYLDSLQVIAHEWTHNYLFFRPLGFDYGRSPDVTTINETVADLVGHELAAEVVKRWPLQQPVPVSPAPAPPTTPAPDPQPPVDVGAVLRELRGQVDVLLAAGKIDEAEALMEQTREDLDSKGIHIRKINQAYFAFLNLYAGAAGSGVATNPIGPRIDQLRQQSPSLRAFLAVIGEVTSADQLNRAVASPAAP